MYTFACNFASSFRNYSFFPARLHSTVGVAGKKSIKVHAKIDLMDVLIHVTDRKRKSL